MKYLGLDLGTKTLGLAMTDRNGTIASPYKVLRYNNYDELIKELLTIIDTQKIEELVLGLPKNMNNSIGPRAEVTLEFRDLLKSKTDLPINIVDERLSTMEATKYLLDVDMRRDHRKKVIDAVAASVILDTYLEMKKSGKN